MGMTLQAARQVVAQTTGIQPTPTPTSPPPPDSNGLPGGWVTGGATSVDSSAPQTGGDVAAVPPGFIAVPQQPGYYYDPVTKAAGYIDTHAAGIPHWHQLAIAQAKALVATVEQQTPISPWSDQGVGIPSLDQGGPITPYTAPVPPGDGAGGSGGSGGMTDYQQQQLALKAQEDAAALAQQQQVAAYNNRGQDWNIVQGAQQGRLSIADAMKQIADARRAEQADPFKYGNYLQDLAGLPPGTGNPLQALIGAGKSIAPDTTSYDNIQRILESILQGYASIPNLTDAERARDALTNPATHQQALDFFNALTDAQHGPGQAYGTAIGQPDMPAYGFNSASQARDFAQQIAGATPEQLAALQQMAQGHASGGEQMLQHPVTAFDEVTGQPVFTAGENGQEGVKGLANGGVRFYPQPGVKKKLAPGQTDNIAAQTAWNVAQRQAPQAAGQPWSQRPAPTPVPVQAQPNPYANIPHVNAALQTLGSPATSDVATTTGPSTVPDNGTQVDTGTGNATTGEVWQPRMIGGVQRGWVTVDANGNWHVKDTNTAHDQAWHAARDEALKNAFLNMPFAARNAAQAWGWYGRNNPNLAPPMDPTGNFSWNFPGGGGWDPLGGRPYGGGSGLNPGANATPPTPGFASGGAFAGLGAQIQNLNKSSQPQQQSQPSGGMTDEGAAALRALAGAGLTPSQIGQLAQSHPGAPAAGGSGSAMPGATGTNYDPMNMNPALGTNRKGYGVGYQGGGDYGTTPDERAYELWATGHGIDPKAPNDAARWQYLSEMSTRGNPIVAYGVTYYPNPGESQEAFNARMAPLQAQEERALHGGVGPNDQTTSGGSRRSIRDALYANSPNAGTATAAQQAQAAGITGYTRKAGGGGLGHGTPGTAAAGTGTGGATTSPAPGTQIDAKAASAISIGKALRPLGIAPPEMLAYLDAGKLPPPGTITQSFLKRLPPSLLALFQGLIKQFGEGTIEDYSQSQHQFDVPGLQLSPTY